MTLSIRTWEPKWKYYHDNLFQAASHGHQCYTYKPDKSTQNQVSDFMNQIGMRSKCLNVFQFSFEVDNKNMELLLGYIHSIDTYHHTFLHKSSVPQFYIPYNNSKLPATALPNHYTYHIKLNVIHDFEDQACTLIGLNESDARNCYSEYLENQMSCSLSWDMSDDISGTCY